MLHQQLQGQGLCTFATIVAAPTIVIEPVKATEETAEGEDPTEPGAETAEG